MKTVYYLMIAVLQTGLTIYNLLTHDYFGIITACFAVIVFGFYIEGLIKDLVIPPKPKKEEDIYE